MKNKNNKFGFLNQNLFLVSFFFSIMLGSFLFFGVGKASAETYYVSSSEGNDSNNGTSTDTPWKSVFKLNSTTFAPDDNILFKRGDTWIGADAGPIIPSASGTSGHPITWGAYGTGNKPIITYASRRSSVSDWTDEGNNIWSTGGGLTTTGSELLSNPSFETDDVGWYTDGSSGGACTPSRTTTVGEYDSGIAGYKIAVANQGTIPLSIHMRMTAGHYPTYSAGKYYLLSFRAKATVEFTIPMVRWSTTSDDVAYEVGTVGIKPTITTDWATYYVIFRPLRTLTNPSIRFHLGGTEGIPNGATFYIDTLSLKELSEPDYFGMYYSSNLIFNSTSTPFAGTMVAPSGPITAQGEWYQSASTRKIYLYSASNPATYYSDILIVSGALQQGWYNKGADNNGKNYQVLENIEFFALDNASYHQNFISNTIRYCKMTWLGGRPSYNYEDYNWGGQYRVRFGQGFGGGGSINGVYAYGNYVDQVYDCNWTYQNTTTSKTIQNIYVYDNVFGRAEYGSEIWMRDNTTTMKDMYVYNNTYWGVGQDWAVNQRPDGNMYQSNLSFSNSTATMSNIKIKNNIFYMSALNQIIFMAYASQWLGALDMSNNIYYGTPTSGTFAKIIYESPGNPYADQTFDTLTEWQAVMSIDDDSLYVNPRFISSSNHYILPTSPAIDAGTDVSLTTDFEGNPIYGLPDIGGYEFQPSFEIGTDGIDITAGARIYGDGKFRDYEGEGAGDTANLSVAPESGSFTTYGDDEVRPFWMDITDITWGNSYKEWKESSDTLGATNTLHTIGNLTPGNTYTLTIDSNPPTGTITGTDCNETGTCIASGSGEIAFVYTGGYSEHTFGLTGESVEEDESEAIQDDEETNLNVNKVKATSTPDSITIEWKTDHKTKSTVSYGTDRNLKEKKKDNDKEKKHKMTLTNLLPNTRYYFRIKAKDGDDNEDKSRIHTIRTKSGSNNQNSSQNSGQNQESSNQQSHSSYSGSATPNICSYTIAEGDTLWSIAKKVYGDATQYSQIIEKNQDKYPNIASKLSIGQELIFCKNEVQEISETKTENSHNDSNNDNSETQAQEPEYARWWNPFSWF